MAEDTEPGVPPMSEQTLLSTRAGQQERLIVSLRQERDEALAALESCRRIASPEDLIRAVNELNAQAVAYGLNQRLYIATVRRETPPLSRSTARQEEGPPLTNTTVGEQSR